eukprot:3485573-Amphidinium_carterae.1
MSPHAFKVSADKSLGRFQYLVNQDRGVGKTLEKTASRRVATGRIAADKLHYPIQIVQKFKSLSSPKPETS